MLTRLAHALRAVIVATCELSAIALFAIAIFVIGDLGAGIFPLGLIR